MVYKHTQSRRLYRFLGVGRPVKGGPDMVVYEPMVRRANEPMMHLRDPAAFFGAREDKPNVMRFEPVDDRELNSDERATGYVRKEDAS